MTTSPLISVIIPTYNQALYLPATLDSVLQQDYSTLELIVIDDGSTDDTARIGAIYQQKDSRVRWLEQENQGPAIARNRGIAEAQGQYICLLDSDDLMHPQRITLQYEAFQQEPSIDILYTALELIDAHGHSLGIMHSQEVPPADFLALMLFRNLIPTSSAIMTKSHCLKEHPYSPSFKHAEDYELMLRLAHQYCFKYLDIPLTCYRRHLTNLSNHRQAHREAEMKIVRQYNQTEIQDIVDQTTFSPEEKTLLKGRILFNQEQDEEALTFFLQLSSSLGLFYQGNCHLRLNRLFQALHAYQEAIKEDATNPACYNNLGVTYARMGELDKGRECFQQAIALNPRYLDAQYNLHHSSQDWQITWRELRPTLLPYI